MELGFSLQVAPEAAMQVSRMLMQGKGIQASRQRHLKSFSASQETSVMYNTVCIVLYRLAPHNDVQLAYKCKLSVTVLNIM